MHIASLFLALFHNKCPLVFSGTATMLKTTSDMCHASMSFSTCPHGRLGKACSNPINGYKPLFCSGCETQVWRLCVMIVTDRMPLQATCRASWNKKWQAPQRPYGLMSSEVIMDCVICPHPVVAPQTFTFDGIHQCMVHRFMEGVCTRDCFKASRAI